MSVNSTPCSAPSGAKSSNITPAQRKTAHEEARAYAPKGGYLPNATVGIGMCKNSSQKAAYFVIDILRMGL